MKAIAYLGFISVTAVVGYAAFAGLAGQPRLLASDATPAAPGDILGPTLIAQAPAATSPVTTEMEAPDQAAGQMDTSVEPAEPRVDETALRYFARQGDTKRVQAELERLRSLYPDWEPPTDLLSDDYVPDPDIIRMWELFSQGDYAGARAAIATKQQSDPTFQPSADLLQSLDTAEAGQRLLNASDAKQYQTVISIAANTPDLLTCETVDNLWRLAEAFARTDATTRAIDAYSYVLTNCTDEGERYATMQKAIELLDRDELRPLFALEKTSADGAGEFAPLLLDLARRSVAAALEEDSDVTPRAADVEQLEKSAQATGNADDLRLLGWYSLSRNQPNDAREWFEAAIEADPSAASTQGLGTTLLALRDNEAAEELLADYRDENDELEELYLDAAAALLASEPRVDLDGDVLGRIVDAVMSARNANTAQELGWYAYEFQQPQTAVEWFNLALRWKVDLEPAAYGLMIAANALNDQTTVDSVRSLWSARSPRIAQFGQTSATTTVPLPRPRPAAHLPVHPVVQAVRTRSAPSAKDRPAAAAGGGSRGCVSFVPPASLSAGAALSHGWCLMELNRPAQAADHFARALQSGSENMRSDAAYGQSLAFLRMGLADEAAIAATAAPLSKGNAIELEIAILTRKATGAYDVGDYAMALNLLDARARLAPERNDLLTLRAWSYYHLRRFSEAKRIFAAVAATGYGDAVSGLNAATSALRAASQ